MTTGNGSFGWDLFIPYVVHPVKVAIIEAMLWIDMPLSARELDLIFDEELGLSLVAYHVRSLADIGAIEKVEQQAVRGALQSFYVLVAKDPAGSALSYE